MRIKEMFPASFGWKGSMWLELPAQDWALYRGSQLSWLHPCWAENLLDKGVELGARTLLMTLVSERKVGGAYRSAGYHVVQKRGPYRGKRNQFDPTVKWMYQPAPWLECSPPVDACHHRAFTVAVPWRRSLWVEEWFLRQSLRNVYMSLMLK